LLDYICYIGISKFKGAAEAAEKEGGSTAEEETTDGPPPAAAMTEAMALRVEEWNHHRSVLLDSW